MTIKALLQQLNITPRNTFFTTCFFAGLILTVFEIDIYRSTFINNIIPICLWIVPGLLTMPFNQKIFGDEIKRSNTFLQLVFSLVSWGGIATYIFMAANFYFGHTEVYRTSLPVISTGNLAKGRNGCGNPYVLVRYNGMEKELIFPCGTSVNEYKYVDISTTSGLFGYEIIRGKSLRKDLPK